MVGICGAEALRSGARIDVVTALQIRLDRRRPPARLGLGRERRADRHLLAEVPVAPTRKLPNRGELVLGSPDATCDALL